MVEKDVKVNVPGYSGFDKTHRVTATINCGTITPILCDELIPGQKVNLKLDLAGQLPPLVSDTYMNVKIKAEAFFCPSRILCKSFESFYSDFPERVAAGADATPPTIAFNDIKGVVPVISMGPALAIALSNSGRLGPGSLSDYLGLSIKGVQSSASGTDYVFNALPFLAYHMIYQEWYRNPRVQNPVFAPFITNLSNNHPPIYSAPWTFYHRDVLNSGTAAVTYPDNHVYNSTDSFGFADGVSFFDLRQRNFGLDMYTAAQLSPQQGTASSVDIVGTDQTGQSFTIAALRAMNSLQQFKERNNIPSSRMVDQTYARYGVKMSDGVAQRPLCLGVAEYDLYTKGVDQTAPEADPSHISGDNPFSSVGAQYGRAYAAGSDFIIDNFEAKEPGYLFVMVTLVPVVSYGYGVDPMFERYIADGSITDMANPILQNVGPEPIYTRELNASPIAGTNVVFGYRDRYGSWKDKPSRVRGLLHDGENLDQFVLQREVTSGSTLTSAFLQIPINYMDSVMISTQASSGFTAWLDAMIHYKTAMPLAKYSIPSLQDPAYEHGHTVSLRKNGQVF